MLLLDRYHVDKSNNEADKSEYKPLCPLGMNDCVCDPSYIYYHYPEWFKELYGDIKPEEALSIYCSKRHNINECYDNEDK